MRSSLVDFARIDRRPVAATPRYAVVVREVAYMILPEPGVG